MEDTRQVIEIPADDAYRMLELLRLAEENNDACAREELFELLGHVLDSAIEGV